MVLVGWYCHLSNVTVICSVEMDYFARAMRVEEIPLLNKQYEEQLVLDKQFWEEQEQERVRSISVLFSQIEGLFIASNAAALIDSH